MDESLKVVYERSQLRIQDLNRAIYNIRILFMALAAGFYAALTFLISFIAFDDFLAAANSYAFLLIFISFLSIVFSVILFLTELIYQEFADGCVETIAHIEQDVVSMPKHRLFDKPGRHLASLRLNTLTIFFYGFFVLSAAAAFTALCRAILSATPFVQLEPVLALRCRKSVEALPPETNVDPVQDCLDGFLAFAFSSDVRFFAGILVFLAGVMLIYFIIFSAQRFLGKLMMAWFNRKFGVDVVANIMAATFSCVWIIQSLRFATGYADPIAFAGAVLP